MKCDSLRDTIAITDLSAYRDNLRKIIRYVGPAVRVMAVVKGNAYGHGMTDCARTALDAGCSMLGVAYAVEGMKLRDTGITAPILALSCESPDCAEYLIENHLTVALPSFAVLREVRKVLKSASVPCRAHIKVDTGMGRIGVHPREAEALLREALDTPGIVVEGIFTHFPVADEDRDDETLGQIRLFRALLDDLTAKGLRPPIAHMCNSAGTIKFPEAYLDMVRPGIMTYGLLPYPGSEEKLSLAPVLSWKSRVALVKEVPSGFAVSYGGTFVTKRPSRLATVPVGYTDGYRRFLSNRGKAIIKGVMVPVTGRICMDQTIFDVTDAGDVRPGDTVTLIGYDGPSRVSAEDIAEIGGTITHEIITGISSRVSRTVIPPA